MQKYYRLSELAEIGRGSSPRPITDNKYFVDGNIPWIKIADATVSGKYILETKEHVNEYGASFSRKLKPGSLIIAASGTLGFPKFLGIEGCIHDGWMYFSDINEDLIDKDYLYYHLITLNKYFNNLSYGAAIQNINTPIVKKTKVLLPSKAIQQKIALILSTYDNLIENNNKRIKLLEQTAENLYKEWFVRFRFPNYENTEFADGIPNGWVFHKITNFSKILSGGDCPKDFIKYPNNEYNIPIFSNGIDNFGLYGYTKEPTISEKSITISARGTVGFVCLRRTPYTPIVRLLSIIPHNPIYVYWLYYYLKYNPLVANGTSQQQITIPMVSKAKVLLPKEKTIQSFNSIVEPYFDEMDIIRKENDLLAKQRDLLLPRLMSGKLSVEKPEKPVLTFAPKMTFKEFCSEMGVAARGKAMTEHNLQAMYEAYINNEEE